ncbi:MAG: hypothetical protein ACOYEB_03735 [Enterococcus lemanii]|jgi:predicted nucleotide-binding protein (sugar kinase/HSP70/actin superfamily)
MFLRKEKRKFEKEFKDMNKRNEKISFENKNEIQKGFFKLTSLQKDFDSKWDSIRKTKQ